MCVHTRFVCVSVYHKPLHIKEPYWIFFLAVLNVGSYHQPGNEDICEIINGTLKWDSITSFAFIY